MLTVRTLWKLVVRMGGGWNLLRIVASGKFGVEPLGSIISEFVFQIQ